MPLVLPYRDAARDKAFRSSRNRHRTSHMDAAESLESAIARFRTMASELGRFMSELGEGSSSRPA